MAPKAPEPLRDLVLWRANGGIRKRLVEFLGTLMGIVEERCSPPRCRYRHPPLGSLGDYHPGTPGTSIFILRQAASEKLYAEKAINPNAITIKIKPPTGKFWRASRASFMPGGSVA